MGGSATGTRKPSRRAAQATISNPELLVSGSDAEFRVFVADLFAAASGMQAVRRALGRAAGLAGSEIAVLLAVWQLSRQGRVSIRDVAAHLHVAGAHVTTEVARLARRRLLSKRESAADPRALDVRLTALGRRRLSRLAPDLRRANDVLFEGMSRDEMAHVHRFFRRIVARSGEAAGAMRCVAGRGRDR